MIRGTPLLVQLWLIYYGVGSILAANPEFRKEYPEIFYYIRQAWPYGFLTLTISFAAYEGEVMRGAFAGVPRGELEAGQAFGMTRGKILRRIWLPRAIHRALPTLNGETILQLKSTPLVATVAVGPYATSSLAGTGAYSIQVPEGTYDVDISFSPHFQKPMILLKNVPGFTGIRVHGGNDHLDTKGCILVGDKLSGWSIKGGTSTPAIRRLFVLVDGALKAGAKVTITVTHGAEMFA